MPRTNVPVIHNFDPGMPPIQAGEGAEVLRSLKTRLVLLLISLFMGFGNSAVALGAELEPPSATLAKATEQGGPSAIPEQEEHGLPQGAVEIARPFGFPITNSMVVTWVVALALIVFAQMATREMKQVP